MPPKRANMSIELIKTSTLYRSIYSLKYAYFRHLNLPSAINYCGHIFIFSLEVNRLRQPINVERSFSNPTVSEHSLSKIQCIPAIRQTLSDGGLSDYHHLRSRLFRTVMDGFQDSRVAFQFLNVLCIQRNT